MRPRRATPLLRIAAAGAILTALAAAPTAAGTFSYTGCVQMASGSYFFNQTARGFYLFNGFSFSSDMFTLTANIPLIYQNTPYVTLSGVGMLPSGGSESSLVGRRAGMEPVVLPEPIDYTRYGLGDPLLFLGIRLWKEGAIIPSAQVSLQTKIPVATLASGFGTGQWDYAAGLSLSKRIDEIFLFGDLNYWTLGDLPELVLKDSLSYGFSLGFAMAGGRAALMGSYSGSTRIIDGVAPPSSLGLGLSVRIASKSSLLLNTSFGLSESSPSLTLSLGWSLGF